MGSILGLNVFTTNLGKQSKLRLSAIAQPEDVCEAGPRLAQGDPNMDPNMFYSFRGFREGLGFRGLGLRVYGFRVVLIWVI